MTSITMAGFTEQNQVREHIVNRLLQKIFTLAMQLPEKNYIFRRINYPISLQLIIKISIT